MEETKDLTDDKDLASLVSSSESIKPGSSDELGSSLGDLFADESDAEIAAFIDEGEKNEGEIEESKEKVPDEVQAAEKVEVADEVIASDQGEEDQKVTPEEVQPDGEVNEEEIKIKKSESKELKTDTATAQPMEEILTETNILLEDSARSLPRAEPEELDTFIYTIDIERNRLNRLRRISSELLDKSSFTTSVCIDNVSEVSEPFLVDFDLPRKKKLDKWEEVVWDLVMEAEREMGKDSKAEKSANIFKVDDFDAANEEQEDEWLVPVDPSHKPTSLRPTSPNKILSKPRLGAKESCTCLRRVFPQLKGYEYSTLPFHFDNGLPIPDPVEHIRKEPLDKIVLNRDYDAVTVTFLYSEGEIYSRPYKRYVKFLEVRRKLAKIFQIPVEVITLQKDNIHVGNDVVLEKLGVLPNGSIELILASRQPKVFPVLSKNILLNIPVTDDHPDVIKVSAFSPTGDSLQDVTVEIFKEAIEKPWLGGYRDRETLVDYHHAFSQTPPLAGVPKYHRDTQTPFPPVTQSQNTPYNKSTQIYRDDYYISNVGDKIMTAKPYIPHNNNDFLKKVLTIQRYIRAWILRKMLKKMSKIFRDQESKKAYIKWKKNIELEHLLTSTTICNVYPRTRQDFSVLYHMVELWRQAEIARAAILKTEAPRKAELFCVLEQEVQLLNAIEKHRIVVQNEKLALRETDFMKKSSQTINWLDRKGKLISMATLGTQRAAELRDLYDLLTANGYKKNKRLEVLVSIKEAVKDYTSRHVKAFEIVSLIERECRCLASEIMTGSELEFLRKRLAKTFREFMKDPVFNPEGSKYFTEETAYLQARTNRFKCMRCDKFLPRNKFVKTGRIKSIQLCTSCSWLEIVGGVRLDLSKYRTIMNALRREEKKHCCASSIAFIMQVEDFYFLINNIWHGKSPISECDYLPDLRLCRWDVASDWSPWNNILLNNIEMHAHVHMDTPELAYCSSFVADVVKKHQIALMHFQSLNPIENL